MSDLDTSPDSAAPQGAQGPTAHPPGADKPCLRPLDAFPIDNPGAADPAARRLLCLRDPSGLAEGTVTLPPLGVAVIDLCDGSRTRAEIRAEFQQRYRTPLSQASLDALLQRLDDAHMLDSPRFRSHSTRVYADFAKSEVRPAHFAGKSYAADPAALLEEIDRYYAPPNGPGLPPPGNAAADSAPPAPRALIAPHVDFQRGGPAYAWVYRQLLTCRRLPSLIILLGTDHGAAGEDRLDLFTLSRKHFDTPIGRLHTDVEAVARVLDLTHTAAPKLAERLLRNEYRHRGEHALEFQAVWLRHTLLRRGDAEQVKIVPVLCGPLGPLMKDPAALKDATQPFLEALRTVAMAHGKDDVLWLCAADLAHVGPRYGDKDSLSPEDCESLERRDRQTLRPVCQGDAVAWVQEISREADRRRVCGLSSIYALLRAAGPLSDGQLRCYAQCHADPGSIVSIASIAF